MWSIRYFAFVMMLVAVLVVGLALKVSAHPEEYCVTTLEELTTRADISLNPGLISELRELAVQCSNVFDEQPGRTHYYGPETERWRPLVSVWWPADLVDRAMCLIRYESTGKATAVNTESGAAGLFQVMPFWWDDKLPDEYKGDRLDPVTNARAAYYIYERQGWRAWSVVNSGKC